MRRCWHLKSAESIATMSRWIQHFHHLYEEQEQVQQEKKEEQWAIGQRSKRSNPSTRWTRPLQTRLSSWLADARNRCDGLTEPVHCSSRGCPTNNVVTDYLTNKVTHPFHKTSLKRRLVLTVQDSKLKLSRYVTIFENIIITILVWN